jgi:hypothetical protein
VIDRRRRMLACGDRPSLPPTVATSCHPRTWEPAAQASTPERGNELPPPNVETSGSRAFTPEHGNARPDRENLGYHESAGRLIGPPGASYSCHSGENCPRPWKRWPTVETMRSPRS